MPFSLDKKGENIQNSPHNPQFSGEPLNFVGISASENRAVPDVKNHSQLKFSFCVQSLIFFNIASRDKGFFSNFWAKLAQNRSTLGHSGPNSVRMHQM